MDLHQIARELDRPINEMLMAHGSRRFYEQRMLLEAALHAALQQVQEAATNKAWTDARHRYEVPASWRCFHCGELFTTWGGARDHFGAVEGAVPGCVIDRVALEEGGKPERGRGLLMELRKAEAKVEAQQQEIAVLRRENGHLVETLMTDDVKIAKAEAERDALQQRLADVEREREEAMQVLAPNMPESGLVDACKQRMQAYIVAVDNYTGFKVALEATKLTLADTKGDLERQRVRCTEFRLAAERAEHQLAEARGRVGLLEDKLEQAQQRVTALEGLTAKALDLLADVCAGHAAHEAAEYNQCDTEPCVFCEDVATLRAAVAPQE